MATKKPTELKVSTDEEKLDRELDQAAETLQQKAGVTDQKDAEIAELRKQLEQARRESAGYRTGNDRQRVEDAIREAEAAGIDPWDVTISVRAPVRTDTSEKSYWCCVNSRSVQIPADDRYHEMKLPFASNLVNMIHAENYAKRFADEQIQEYDPITNPHPVN